VTAVDVEVTVLWEVTCNLIDGYQLSVSSGLFHHMHALILI
jgi:hypothetical protein